MSVYIATDYIIMRSNGDKYIIELYIFKVIESLCSEIIIALYGVDDISQHCKMLDSSLLYKSK